MTWGARKPIALQLFQHKLVNDIPANHFSFHNSLISDKIIFAGKFLFGCSSEDTRAQIQQELTLFRKRCTPLVHFTVALGSSMISILLTLIRERTGFEKVEVHSIGALKTRSRAMDPSQYLTGSSQRAQSTRVLCLL